MPLRFKLVPTCLALFALCVSLSAFGQPAPWQPFSQSRRPGFQMTAPALHNTLESVEVR